MQVHSNVNFQEVKDILKVIMDIGYCVRIERLPEKFNTSKYI